MNKIEKIINEAISIKNARKRGLTRNNSGSYRNNKINDVFDGKDRLIFPIDIESDELNIETKGPLFSKIEELLSKEYNISISSFDNYKKGLSYKKEDRDKKQPYKIGKLLKKLVDKGNDDAKVLYDSFVNDPKRRTKGSYNVVISRHPYDVAGMSTDRNWSSCMNLGYKPIEYSEERTKGQYSYSVKNDIWEGTLVAYLVSDEDRHKNGKLAIRRPLSRTLIKPFESKDKKDRAYGTGKVYGVANSLFRSFVRKWTEDNLNNELKYKDYYKIGGLYFDGELPAGDFKIENKNVDYTNAFMSALEYVYIGDRDIAKYVTVDHHNAYGGGIEFEVTVVFKLNLGDEEFQYGGRGYSVNHMPDKINNLLDIQYSDYVRQVSSHLYYNENIVEYTEEFYILTGEDEKDENGEEMFEQLFSDILGDFDYDGMLETLKMFFAENDKKQNELDFKSKLKDVILTLEDTDIEFDNATIYLRDNFRNLYNWYEDLIKEKKKVRIVNAPEDDIVRYVKILVENENILRGFRKLAWSYDIVRKKYFSAVDELLQKEKFDMVNVNELAKEYITKFFQYRQIDVYTFVYELKKPMVFLTVGMRQSEADNALEQFPELKEKYNSLVESGLIH